MKMPSPRTGYQNMFVEVKKEYYDLIEKLSKMGITKKMIVNTALELFFERGIEQIVKDLAVNRAKELGLIEEEEESQGG